jgi:hypothetical protein
MWKKSAVAAGVDEVGGYGSEEGTKESRQKRD